MNADAVRKILLVKAVEEQDGDGAVLTLAERDAATRDALRAHPAATGEAGRQEQQARAWRVLGARAALLHARLVERHPVVERTAMLESHAALAATLTVVAGFALGLALSVLDSRVRVEIVAFPLLGLVLWNLAVYAALAWAAVRGRARTGSRQDLGSAGGWVTWPARWGWRRAAALVKQSSLHHRPLAAALRRFGDAWWPLVQPLVLLQGKRIFHLAAAATAVGLVAGFYVRGIALEYRAGWESTFLGPAEVLGWVGTIYGPAAAATGIVLPATVAEIEALHWRGGAGGGPAAPWIHLIAATALLFVVLPRLALAAWASLGIAHWSRSMPLPDSLGPYARNVLDGSSAALPAVRVRVTPFAFDPDAAAIDGLRRLLAEAFGPATQVEPRRSVAYGDETRFGELRGEPPVDVEIVLLNLAATPEVENHGLALDTAGAALVRDDARLRRVALVDASAFIRRMGNDAGLAGRVEERRCAWHEFVTRHGWEACVADLAAIATTGDAPAEAVETLRRGRRAPAP
jgi:hypothetical protein